MEEACQAVQDRISSVGGSFNFHMKPKVVTATDEADLAKQLERAEQENAEVNIGIAIYIKLGLLHLSPPRFVCIPVCQLIIRLAETKTAKKKLAWEDLQTKMKEMAIARRIELPGDLDSVHLLFTMSA